VGDLGRDLLEAPRIIDTQSDAHSTQHSHGYPTACHRPHPDGGRLSAPRRSRTKGHTAVSQPTTSHPDLTPSFADATVAGYLADLAAKVPAPGGGAVAALHAAQG